MGKKKAGDGATDKLVNLAARALLGLALLLPYKLRVPLVGWATTT
ncbi:MAG: lauroyl acyltransferase, partial [Silicimonas sp.]|nr:lauroyl acyltransferase [Silicimonas sp.]